MSIRKTMRSRKIMLLVYVICLFVLAYFFYKLFYNQAISTDGKYYSDLPAHIEFGRSGTGYSLIDIILGFLTKCDMKLVGWFASALMIITIVGGFFFIKQVFSSETFLLPAVFSVFSVFVAPLYIPYVSPYFDLTGIILQPWHSLTYIGMRAGAVWVMVLFAKNCDTYKGKGFSTIEWMLLTVLLTITTWVKPNFLISYSLALLVLLIIDFTKSRFEMSTFGKCFLCGLSVLPAVGVAIAQGKLLFTTGIEKSSTGIAISLSSSSFLKNGGRAAVLQAITGLLFPVAIYFWNKKQQNRTCKFVAGMFAISFLQILFFVENGSRSNDNNFYWGIYLAGYFLFLTCYAIFERLVFDVKDKTRAKKIANVIFLVICGFLILWHTFSGVLRFWLSYSGVLYSEWPWIVEPYFKWMYSLVY